ncbi:Oligopeptide transport system permease protein OppC [Tsuneonella dongtanensis]|uniref:Oligopeptide transport system permease protein OppC n=1 Tax=Tsuneonella dongtanensis TaxID=692370 RepID=A0A1B2AGW3_9SPHN|nr:ABC transporter permease subunit [Tsuneonella dongtanensis]ANY21382.1 Oligopeptide transport system permease protein OppC [Tsuneonella dongtanensis]
MTDHSETAVLGNEPVPPPISAAEIADEELVEGSSLWKDAWARLRKNRLAVGSLVTFVVIVLFCLVGPLLSPWDANTQDLFLGATGPSAQHWFGTDTLGRDLMVRVMYGGRISLLVGLVATLVALSIGVVYGATAGYVGGRTDSAMMRFVDLLYALPFTIFVILLMVAFGRSLWLMFVAIGAVEWLSMARIVRSGVIGLKKQEFVEAAVSLGYSHKRIILRHLIPNVLGPVIVIATLTVPAVMLLEAFLSFLGLGVQPPDASWGVLINEGQQNMEIYPWLLIFPAAFFATTLFCLNFIGDGLRDALDPKSAKD